MPCTAWSARRRLAPAVPLSPDAPQACACPTVKLSRVLRLYVPLLLSETVLRVVAQTTGSYTGRGPSGRQGKKVTVCGPSPRKPTMRLTLELPQALEMEMCHDHRPDQ